VSLSDEAVYEVARAAAGDRRGARAALDVVAAAGGSATQRKAILEAVAAGAPDEDAMTRAAALLARIEAAEDYILEWQIAGPYTVAGKQGPELLDTPLGPEVDAASVQWRSSGSDVETGRPWVVDLKKAFGGDHRAAYMRAIIVSDAARDAQLEIGSDDGVTAWLNGTVVHSNNASRPVRPGEDKATVTLKAGANVLLMKVVQGAGGWGACARLRALDGKHLPGISYRLPES
jgi:hypothetical protein